MMLSSKSSLGALSTSNSANSDISYMSVSEAAARSHQESHGGSSTASTSFDFTSEIIPVRTHNLYQYSHASSSTPSTNTFGVPKFLPPSSLTSEPSPHDLVSQLPPPSERLNLPVPGTCIFKPTGNGTMALYPPRKAALQTPLYIISVSPNCFVPTSFVTTVESGRTERLVATFEMGPSRDPPTLFTDNTAYQLDDVLKPFRVVKSLASDRWNWERGRFQLHWQYDNPYKASCYQSHDPTHTIIAVLTSAAAAYAQVGLFAAPVTRGGRRNSTLSNNTSSSGGGAVTLNGPPTTQLWVLTSDEALLDEIVVSALVVERKRLMPKTGWPQ